MMTLQTSLAAHWNDSEALLVFAVLLPSDLLNSLTPLGTFD